MKVIDKDLLLQTCADDGQGVYVRFVWHQDRFAHTVGVMDRDRFVPVLSSIEGSEQDNWPPSPAFQDVSSEPRQDGSKLVLLVGSAGNSHWSASVETNASSAAILFDVACRIHEPPRCLGSTYRTQARPPLIGSWQVEIEVARQVCHVQLKEVDGSDPRFEATDGGFAVTLPEVSESYPQTIRWKYHIQSFNRPSRSSDSRHLCR